MIKTCQIKPKKSKNQIKLMQIYLKFFENMKI